MKTIIAASLLLQMTIACSIPVQPVPTASATPVFMPTSMSTGTSTPTSLPPTETQVIQATSEWNGIPIMPGAIAGEGDNEGYVFTIQASAQQVQDYYRLELGKLGWQPLSQESDDSSLTLIFIDSASVMLTVSIISKGENVLVLLVI